MRYRDINEALVDECKEIIINLLYEEGPLSMKSLDKHFKDKELFEKGTSRCARIAIQDLINNHPKVLMNDNLKLELKTSKKKPEELSKLCISIKDNFTGSHISLCGKKMDSGLFSKERFFKSIDEWFNSRKKKHSSLVCNECFSKLKKTVNKEEEDIK